MLFFGVGAALAAAMWAGWTVGGFRGAMIVLFCTVMLWVSRQVVDAFDLRAERDQLKTELATANQAFDDFRTASDLAAKSAAARIEALEAARAQADRALDAARQAAAADLAKLKQEIDRNVPARPQCDYPQPVLDRLRDGWDAAQRRREGAGAR